MANFRDKIRNSPEYREITQQTAADAATEPREVDTVSEAVDPVVSFEKGDIQFWMQVATVVLLLLIYRELAHASGQAIAQQMVNGGTS